MRVHHGEQRFQKKLILPSGDLRMLNWNFLRWVILSVSLAFPISLFSMRKWLESFAYRIDLSWWIFALAAVIAILVALLTVSIQSWKASRNNPVEALRYE